MVKELVDLYGGTISVKNTGGAVFSLVLPMEESSPTSSPQAFSPDSAFAQPQPLPEIKVPQDTLPILLLVEDNVDVRRFIRQELEEEFQVLEASHGEEGLKMAKKHLPDLIITDLMMPVMDGFALTQQAKSDELTSHIPVILLTARAEVEDKITGLEIGADDYLTKPFHGQELRIRVHNLIEQRRKLRQKFSREVRVAPGDITVTSADEAFLKRAIALVESEIGNADFRAGDLQQAMNMSRSHFHRKIQSLTGQSPSGFIRTLRLKRAASLLGAEADNVAQIAYQTGFNNLSWFAKCFKEVYGVLPSEYGKGEERSRF